MTGGNKRATRHSIKKRTTMHKRKSSKRQTCKRFLKSSLKSTKRIH